MTLRLFLTFTCPMWSMPQWSVHQYLFIGSCLSGLQHICIEQVVVWLSAAERSGKVGKASDDLVCVGYWAKYILESRGYDNQNLEVTIEINLWLKNYELPIKSNDKFCYSVQKMSILDSYDMHQLNLPHPKLQIGMKTSLTANSFGTTHLWLPGTGDK